jgi:hypothetical protein
MSGSSLSRRSTALCPRSPLLLLLAAANEGRVAWVSGFCGRPVLPSPPLVAGPERNGDVDDGRPDL